MCKGEWHVQTQDALDASVMRKTARAEASRSGFHHVMMTIHSVRDKSKSIEFVLEFAQAMNALLKKYSVQVRHDELCKSSVRSSSPIRLRLHIPSEPRWTTKPIEYQFYMHFFLQANLGDQCCNGSLFDHVESSFVEGYRQVMATLPVSSVSA